MARQPQRRRLPRSITPRSGIGPGFVASVGDVTLSAALIAENAPEGTIIGTLSANPVEGTTYTLLDAGANRTKLLSGGRLAVGPAASNYEAGTSFQIIVRAQWGQASTDQTFTITITDVDEISNITLSNASILESAAAAAVVGALTSTPTGATFSMVDTAGNRFAISGNNLVRGATALDTEVNATHTVTIRGTRLGETFDKNFTITVTDVDEITNISLATPTIASGAAQGTVVGALTSTPAGATYTMPDTAGGRFGLSGSNVIAGATPTDSEAATSHDVTVRGTRLSETFDKVITITVT
ncbi:hypothetical protein BAJUN_02270 [Bajunvirus bajun]|uniref:Cadherin domain-containing protein n=1 Tax=Brevundimonas phage vB_BgoS-Bajun TaxID=2948594 RepID=A0A9E7SUW7_9CAUD|nr:hypothetical protein BAJUN_02270 [Brevundimonas phage vB_BgoS-Bajun]